MVIALNQILSHAESPSDDFYVKVNAGKESNIGTITLNKSDVVKLGNAFLDNFKTKIELRENLYITAIRNYHKTTNFLKLVNNLSEKLITEEDFEKEINENEEKYEILANGEIDFPTLRLITDIVQKVGIEYSMDEISEIFSINPIKLEQIAGQLIK